MRRIALLLTLFAALALCAPGCGALSEGLTLPQGYACQTLFEEDGAFAFKITCEDESKLFVGYWFADPIPFGDEESLQEDRNRALDLLDLYSLYGEDNYAVLEEFQQTPSARESGYFIYLYQGPRFEAPQGAQEQVVLIGMASDEQGASIQYASGMTHEELMQMMELGVAELERRLWPDGALLPSGA